MPTFSGSAKTRLGLTATNRRRPGTFTKVEVIASRPGLPRLTTLGLTATTARKYAFTAKPLSLTNDAVGSATVTPIVTVGDVSDVNARLYVLLRPVVTVSATTGYLASGSADITPVITMAWALSQSGTIAKTPAADIVPIVTVASFVSVEIGTVASIIPVVTASGVTDLQKAGTAISIIPVIEMTVLLDKVVGAIARFPTADLTPVVTVTARARDAGEVDNITTSDRPFGYIRVNEI